MAPLNQNRENQRLALETKVLPGDPSAAWAQSWVNWACSFEIVLPPNSRPISRLL